VSRRSLGVGGSAVNFAAARCFLFVASKWHLKLPSISLLEDRYFGVSSSAHCFVVQSGNQQQIWAEPLAKRKQERTNMKLLLALICGVTLSIAYAQTQPYKTAPATSPSSGLANPSTSTMSTGTSKTPRTTGTVTEYTPGSSITIDPGTGKPEQFTISDKVEVVGSDGKMIAKSDVKKNSRVHLRTVQEGDRTVVDQITVESTR
jgi:hypothetical protein